MTAEWALRLQKAVADKGWKLTELHRRSGVSIESIRKYHSGAVANPRGDVMEKLADALGVDTLWLQHGVTSPRSRVTLVGYVGAGAVIYAMDDHERGAGLEYVEAPPDNEPGTVAVRVRGDSMYPAYRDGDLLYYNEHASAIEDCLGRECIVRLTDGSTVVKFVEQGSDSERLTLISYNAPPMPNVQIEWAARVAWVRKA